MTQRQATYTARRFHDPLDDLLDRPISYNPAFKRITGSTVAALMLSQGWYWSKRTSDEDGWFWKTGEEWEEETGLSRSEQETARRILGSLGVMEEDLRGVPATKYYRIDKPKIYTLMGIQFAGFPQTEIVEIPQTSMSEPSEQDCDIPANLNRTEITTEITQERADAQRKSEVQKSDMPEWAFEHGEDLTPSQIAVIEANSSKKWKYRESFPSELLPLADLAVKKFGAPIKAKHNNQVALYLEVVGSWYDSGCTIADWHRALEITRGYSQPLVKITGMTDPLKVAAQERKEQKLPAPQYKTLPKDENNYVPNPLPRPHIKTT